jgi:hypothetical protein
MTFGLAGRSVLPAGPRGASVVYKLSLSTDLVAVLRSHLTPTSHLPRLASQPAWRVQYPNGAPLVPQPQHVLVRNFFASSGPADVLDWVQTVLGWAAEAVEPLRLAHLPRQLPSGVSFIVRLSQPPAEAIPARGLSYVVQGPEDPALGEPPQRTVSVLPFDYGSYQTSLAASPPPAPSPSGTAPAAPAAAPAAAAVAAPAPAGPSSSGRRPAAPAARPPSPGSAKLQQLERRAAAQGLTLQALAVAAAHAPTPARPARDGGPAASPSAPAGGGVAGSSPVAPSEAAGGLSGSDETGRPAKRAAGLRSGFLVSSASAPDTGMAGAEGP